MTAAKPSMGRRVEMLHPANPCLRSETWGTRIRGGASFVDAVEGDEEEVDGEGHPEGDEDVRDVEAGVDVRADAGGHGEGGVEAGAVGGDGGPGGDSAHPGLRSETWGTRVLRGRRE